MAKQHPEQGDLIDFAEGEVSRETAEQIEGHLKICDGCRSYVESAKRAFLVLGMDRVPEPPPGYWAYFEQRVREHARSKKRLLALALVPGLAAAAALIMVFWLFERPEAPQIQGMDLIMADMTTGEIVEAVSDDPYAGPMLLGFASEDVEGVEAYLYETEDIYHLVDRLSETERQRFIRDLEEKIRGT